MTLNAFKVVPMNVARNPVARAVAKTRITNAVRDFQIRLYTLTEDDDVVADVQVSLQVLMCAVRAMELCGRGAEPAAGVMRGAISTLLQCAERRWRWHPADAPAVDTGLQRAVEIYPALPAHEVALAWRYVNGLAAA